MIQYDDQAPTDAWYPQSGERPRPRQGSAARYGLLISAKTVLAAISVLTLAATGYYWSKLDAWSDGLTKQDVIAGTPTERPADGAIDILMVGMDSRTDAQGNPLSKELLAQLTAGKVDGTLNTDTLIMIRIPNSGGRAVGVSMPRDSYVDVPGYGKHKINSAYARAKNTAMERLRGQGLADQAQLEVRSNIEGAKSLIATVEKLTGATIDHYAEVNLLGFHDITLAVGGIEVCLKEPVNDKLSGARFPAGRQTLSGTPALAFVRQRHGLPNGDLDRIVRQQIFMSGMAKKVFSTGMLAPGSDTLDKLRQAVQKSVVLDKDWNIIQFAQQMVNFTGGNLDFKTIPVGNPAMRTPNDGDAIEISPQEVRTFVKGLLAGENPPASSTVPASPDAWSPQNITVDVRNASGRSGLANEVSASLAGKGFRTGTTGNATVRTTSVVRFRTGEQANGERVAAELGGIAVEPDGNVAKSHVTVLLGKDFDLEAGTQFAGNPLLALHPLSRQPPGPSTEGCVY